MTAILIGLGLAGAAALLADAILVGAGWSDGPVVGVRLWRWVSRQWSE